MPFRVELDVYRGPMDLLLYLVRKHEVEIEELPVAPIAEQFLEYLEVLKQIDVNSVGDFLEMASTLAEIKSRTVLPRCDEVEEELEDPRQDLVRQLLEYKKFKDAACILEERSRSWQERFPRLANDLPPRERDLAAEPVHELEIWDLVSSFSRIIRDSEAVKPASIVYDETPIQVHMQRLYETMVARGRLAFSEMFRPEMHKSTLVGIFLAMMELVRRHGVLAEQDQLFGEIWLYPDPEAEGELDFSDADDYAHPVMDEEAEEPSGD